MKLMPSNHELSELWSFCVVESANMNEPAEMIFARMVSRHVAESCAMIVDKYRGPIEIYNKRYPAFFDCAQEIRMAKEEIGK